MPGLPQALAIKPLKKLRGVASTPFVGVLDLIATIDGKTLATIDNDQLGAKR